MIIVPAPADVPSPWFGSPLKAPGGGPMSAWPPLNAMLLAALCPADVEVSIIDEYVETADPNLEADLVAISVLTAAAPRAYELAGLFRTRGILVVMGGPHVTGAADDAAAHADAIVIGEGESVWPSVLADAGTGSLQPVYVGEPLTDLSGLPLPRWDLVKRERYVVPDIIGISRGCTNSCDFCYLNTKYKAPYRLRPIPEVIAEIEAMPPGRFMFLTDDNLAADPVYAKELLRAMIPLKKRWLGQATNEVTEDDELMELLARSGCHTLLWNARSFATAKAKSDLTQETEVAVYRRAVKRFHHFGIATAATIIVGADDSRLDIEEIVWPFIKKCGFVMPYAFMMTPLPGTPLERRLRREGRNLDTDWGKFDFFHSAFAPLTQTNADVETSYAGLIKKIHAPGMMLRRAFTGTSVIMRSLRWQPRGPIALWGDFAVSLRFFRLYVRHGRDLVRRLDRRREVEG